jgi:diguanylate cyclase (GGDEF)-like protein
MMRILIADDSSIDANLDIRALRDAGLEFEHRVVWTEETYRSAIADFKPDIVLCDFQFPNFDGPLAFEILRELSPVTPLIFVSGTVSEERAVIAVQYGAADYVLKSNLLRLPGAVTRAVDHAREISAHLAAEERVRSLSRTKDMLSAVNSAIVRIRDRPELFSEACRIAGGQGEFAACFIFTLDANRRADIPAIHGIRQEPLGRLHRSLQDVVDDYANARSLVAESLRTLAPTTLNNAIEHPYLASHEVVVELGIQSMASFPFVSAGRATGGMVFLSRDNEFFGDEEMALLTSLTSNITFALDLMDKQARLDYLFYYDTVTGLANRTLFLDRLRHALGAAARSRSLVALMILDLQQFAQLNARLGPKDGDAILRQIADRLRAAHGDEAIARLQGDRFALSFPPAPNLQSIVETLGDSGLRIFDEAFVVNEHALKVSARVGCAVYPEDGDDAEALMRSAEVALEGARSAEGHFQFYSRDLGERMEQRIDLESRLQRALDESQFELHYQPKVDAATRELIGVEALIRWRDPARENVLIGPSEFIHVLEQTDMIVAVGRWALCEAARQYAQWRKLVRAAPRIAVNLSAKQLSHPNVVDHVRAAVEMCGGYCGLDVEITESVLMEDVGMAASRLNEIRALGVQIALDDFGTGYSSLAALQRLPIRTLKIDRSFVDGMTDDADKTTMITTIISMAQSLRLSVVAEGVETEEQARLLRLLRCDQMQGYLFARPGPPESLSHFF